MPTLLMLLRAISIPGVAVPMATPSFVIVLPMMRVPVDGVPLSLMVMPPPITLFSKIVPGQLLI